MRRLVGLSSSSWCRRVVVVPRCYLSSYATQRHERVGDIQDLPESRALRQLQQFLEKADHSSAGVHELSSPRHDSSSSSSLLLLLSHDQIRLLMDAMMITFGLHVESRIAALLGYGYYTIGPCGEEAMAAAALALQPTDSVALHYRHAGITVARRLLLEAANNNNQYQPLVSSMDDLLLDRARAHCVSGLDPVTHGVHCSLGSTSLHDYVVTSTLASQCPAAVGRALGYALTNSNKKKQVSFVTIGDGSVHNAHYWSAFHLARHARHKHIKCPVVFGIADNGRSISYPTQGYVQTTLMHDPLVPVFHANGCDGWDVYEQTQQAVQYARSHSAPCVVIYQTQRRFGHAATDRQSAYLTAAEIQAQTEMTLLEDTMTRAVHSNATTFHELRDRLQYLVTAIQEAFVIASQEPKVTREAMLERVSQPLVSVPAWPQSSSSSSVFPGMFPDGNNNGIKKTDVMRKHMTRVLMEVMESDESIVYLGEDVIHGGYYVVTEGLATRFPQRVMDFPPDETSLLGAALGFSQLGLTPIVEIPYAKYLDCGADMFYEIALLNWLTGGQRPNGMIIRLQGFDRGLFGGTFHTSNMLPHIPPGVDVVCFSNGADYVRGFRHAVVQAHAGRVVVVVDCTHLLQLRHLYDKDRGWERSYPDNKDEYMRFEDIRRYGTEGQWAIWTYGNGVVTALQARRQLASLGVIAREQEVDILDCPYLSSVPAGARQVLGQYRGILFADICKEGPGSNVLSATVCRLQSDRQLPDKWSLVAAPRTYNPLGSMVTFLNVADIVDASRALFSENS